MSEPPAPSPGLASGGEEWELVEQLLQRAAERPESRAEIASHVNSLSPEAQVRFALGWVEPEKPGAPERIREGARQGAQTPRSRPRGRWGVALTLGAAAWLSLSPSLAEGQRAGSVASQENVEAQVAENAHPERPRPPLAPTAEQLAVMGYQGIPGAENVQVSHPRFAERLSEMARKSRLVRRRLQELGRNGMPVYVVTPEEIPVIWPDFPFDLKAEGFYLGAAYLPEETGPLSGAMVIVDLAEMERVYEAAGASQRERDEDLDVILGHELISHIGSTAKTGRAEDYCNDPTAEEIQQNEGVDACAVREDNRIRRELRTSLEPRRTYLEAGVHYERFKKQLEEAEAQRLYEERQREREESWTKQRNEILRSLGLPVGEPGAAPSPAVGTGSRGEVKGLAMYGRLQRALKAPAPSAPPRPPPQATLGTPVAGPRR